jgi:hypothetical protein
MGLLPKNHLRKRGLFAYVISASALAENLSAIRLIARCIERLRRDDLEMCLVSPLALENLDRISLVGPKDKEIADEIDGTEIVRKQ